MKTEIEAKFLDIDKDALRKKLQDAGAILVYQERLMRRKVYEHPTNKQNDWFRVRDEGDKVTISYKRLVDRSLHGTKEITSDISDFDEGCKLLEAAQLKFVSYQETKREKWKIHETEITIDTWPWVPAFAEIESPDEEEIKRIAELLGFEWTEALHGSVENVYTSKYDVTEEEVCDWPEITFIEVPEWLAQKKK